MKKVEWFTSDGDHLAFMTIEEQVPEEGEDSFMWPVFTEVATLPNYPDIEEWLTDIVGGVEVLDEKGNMLVWEDEDYLDYMIKEFRPGALTAVLV